LELIKPYFARLLSNIAPKFMLNPPGLSIYINEGGTLDVKMDKGSKAFCSGRQLAPGGGGGSSGLS
jgi:hypothetical protein